MSVEAENAVYDFCRALDDYITARVRYDRDGPRYAGENPPDESGISRAFTEAVRLVGSSNES